MTRHEALRPRGVAAALCCAARAALGAGPDRQASPRRRALGDGSGDRGGRRLQEGRYAVTAIVVDIEGVRQAVLRGDGAPVHTLDSAYAKAYTAASLAPVRKEDSTKASVGAASRKTPGVSRPPGSPACPMSTSRRAA